jgi:hypothetical protein
MQGLGERDLPGIFIAPNLSHIFGDIIFVSRLSSIDLLFPIQGAIAIQFDVSF